MVRTALLVMGLSRCAWYATALVAMSRLPGIEAREVTQWSVNQRGQAGRVCSRCPRRVNRTKLGLRRKFTGTNNRHGRSGLSRMTLSADLVVWISILCGGGWHQALGIRCWWAGLFGPGSSMVAPRTRGTPPQPFGGQQPGQIPEQRHAAGRQRWRGERHHSNPAHRGHILDRRIAVLVHRRGDLQSRRDGTRWPTRKHTRRLRHRRSPPYL